MHFLRSRVLLLCLPVALVGMAACSSTSSARSETSSTLHLSSLPDTAATTTTSGTSTSNTSGDSTPGTDAPTTTEAPTTTVAPTTTLAPNVQVVGVSAVPIVAVGGSSGPDTTTVQMRLNQLGFWTQTTNGKYDFSTTQAVMAFQKYLGLPRNGRVDATTAAFLQNFNERAHGQSDNGSLVEVDKGKQLLFLVVDGQTTYAFNTSTGSGIPYTAKNKNDPTKIETGDAVTPNGLFKVYRQRPDGWWDGDLGKIYRPKYFRGGVAIHGMTSIPSYPASHGCVRLSTMAMDFIWDQNLIPMGTPVWVHE
jgi:peptidoglycan hydrolase-like protein with peptidoglycan-binding domain